MNGNDIVTTSNADIELAPNGTGNVRLLKVILIQVLFNLIVKVIHMVSKL